MTIEQAKYEIMRIYGNVAPDIQQAFDTAFKAMDAQAYLRMLSDRPCAVCKCHEETGCRVWKCPFDGMMGEKE